MSILMLRLRVLLLRIHQSLNFSQQIHRLVRVRAALADTAHSLLKHWHATKLTICKVHVWLREVW